MVIISPMIDILSPLLSDIAKIGDMVYQKYRSDVQVSIKEDQTPVTNVDHMVHEQLMASLSHFFPDVPVISEEGDMPSVKARQAMSNYWLVDPLDGTLDFIQETDHFVISLGYISDHRPTMGFLHHPVSGKTWVAIKNRGVFTQYHGDDLQPMNHQLNAQQPKTPKENYIVLVSAHRNDEDLCNIVVRQREQQLNMPIVVKPVGSALKYGYLADGLGDEILRFTPMKGWDFAAGHCLVQEAGLMLFQWTQMKKLTTQMMTI